MPLVASTAVHSKAGVCCCLFIVDYFSHCLCVCFLPPFLLRCLSCYAVHGELSIFCIHLAGEERVSWFTFIVFLISCVLCLFLTVPLVGLQCVIVEFPGHTHFFKEILLYVCM